MTEAEDRLREVHTQETDLELWPENLWDPVRQSMPLPGYHMQASSLPCLLVI